MPQQIFPSSTDLKFLCAESITRQISPDWYLMSDKLALTRKSQVYMLLADCTRNKQRANTSTEIFFFKKNHTIRNAETACLTAQLTSSGPSSMFPEHWGVSWRVWFAASPLSCPESSLTWWLATVFPQVVNFLRRPLARYGFLHNDNAS